MIRERVKTSPKKEIINEFTTTLSKANNTEIVFASTFLCVKICVPTLEKANLEKKKKGKTLSDKELIFIVAGKFA
jgi:hypothetical protein